MVGKVYRCKADGSFWRHAATWSSAQYPVELTGTQGTVGMRTITRMELWAEYEEV
jgi:hypothetical protein